MKDWASARERVEGVKAIDPVRSAKLNKEITEVRSGALLVRSNRMVIIYFILFYLFNNLNIDSKSIHTSYYNRLINNQDRFRMSSSRTTRPNV